MRKRNVDPSLFSDPDLGDVECGERLCFLGCHCIADKNGNLEDDPRRLKALLFPFDDVDTTVMVERLVQAGVLMRYRSNDGGAYLHIPERYWSLQYLSSDERRKAKVKLPTYDESTMMGHATLDNGATVGHATLDKGTTVGHATLDKGEGEEMPTKEHVEGTCDVRQQSIALTTDNGQRTTEYSSPPAVVRLSEEELEKIGDAVRGAHDSCEKLQDAQVAVCIRALMGNDYRGLWEAIEAFRRQKAGAAWMNAPLQEFEKYLRKAVRDRDGVGFGKKRNGAGEGDPPPTEYVLMAERKE